MNKILCFVLSIGGFFLPELSGAEPSYDVTFPQGDASWVIAIEKGLPSEKENASKPKASESRTIKIISVVRKGNVRRDTVAWTDGSTTEYWWPGKLNIVLFQAEKDGPVRVMKAGMMGARRFDETIFSWVNASTFVENQNFHQKKCYYHEGFMPGEDGEKYRLQAWIDADNGKPVAWSDGITVALFTFDENVPGGALVMSEKFQKEFKRMEAYYSAPKKSGT